MYEFSVKAILIILLKRGTRYEYYSEGTFNWRLCHIDRINDSYGGCITRYDVGHE
jgi:hypothetical protein